MPSPTSVRGHCAGALCCWTLGVLAAHVALPLSLAAQDEGVARGFEFERRGKYTEAAEAYRLVLLKHPTEVSALLGMERALLPLGRSGDIVPQVQAALAADSTMTVAFGVGVRAWGALGRQDSLQALVERWVRVQPDDDAPYREWGRAALRQRDRHAARRAYRLGRERLGTSGALAAALAELAALERNYAEAAREWIEAISDLPGYRNAALRGLGDAPAEAHEEIGRALAGDGRPEAHHLLAMVYARWGDPESGLAVLNDNLPGTAVAQLELYRAFMDELRGLNTDTAKQVRAQILEAISARITGPESARLRLDAARAFAEGGDPAGARRMLAGLAEDRQVPADLAAGATVTLIKILIAEEHFEEAEERLGRHASELNDDDVLGLWRAIAAGWLANGELDRAESAIARDQSIEGVAFGGMIRLYRGDLRGAVQAFEEAGPFAGSRNEATGRTALLALIQPIGADSSPELGRGLLALAQGDTAAALSTLKDVAGRLPDASGGAELWLLTARLEMARGRSTEAERLLRKAAVDHVPATAPAALLDLATLLASTGRADEAVPILEHLILAFADSALVPQARRLLNRIRGQVPRI